MKCPPGQQEDQPPSTIALFASEKVHKDRTLIFVMAGKTEPWLEKQNHGWEF
jgi:hypothetical protein